MNKLTSSPGQQQGPGAHKCSESERDLLLPLSISVNAEWPASAGRVTRLSITQSNCMEVAGLVPEPGEQEILKLICKGHSYSS